MNNKGFTIVEVLVTIALILLIASFVIPSIFKSSNSTREKQYNSQIALILIGGREYGEANLNSLNSSCTNVTVGTLINSGYIKSDGEENGEKVLLDPRDQSNTLNDIEVCIKYIKYFESTSEIGSKSQYKVITCIVGTEDCN